MYGKGSESGLRENEHLGVPQKVYSCAFLEGVLEGVRLVASGPFYGS